MMKAASCQPKPPGGANQSPDSQPRPFVAFVLQLLRERLVGSVRRIKPRPRSPPQQAGTRRTRLHPSLEPPPSWQRPPFLFSAASLCQSALGEIVGCSCARR